MAINFDNLPKESPFALPTPDIYKAKIVEAEMRKPKDANKNPYLNLKYTLTNAEGKNCGSMYDIIAESDSSVVQYKIGRFISACGIPLVGTMELADIAKLVLNKTIAVDVTIDDKGQQPRAQVDIFSREAYYPIGQFEEIYNLIHGEEPASEIPADAPFMNIPETADETADAVEY